MDMLGMVILGLLLGWFFQEGKGKGKSQMAALIASPKTLHIECYVYLWQIKQKHSFICVHSSVCFNWSKKKKNPHKNRKGTEVKQKTWSLFVHVVDPGLLIYNSQFDIVVQNSDTDYRHMICLGLAPVHWIGLQPALHRLLHVTVAEGW